MGLMDNFYLIAENLKAKINTNTVFSVLKHLFS